MASRKEVSKSAFRTVATDDATHTAVNLPDTTPTISGEEHAPAIHSPNVGLMSHAYTPTGEQADDLEDQADYYDLFSWHPNAAHIPIDGLPQAYDEPSLHEDGGPQHVYNWDPGQSLHRQVLTASPNNDSSTLLSQNGDSLEQLNAPLGLSPNSIVRASQEDFIASQFSGSEGLSAYHHQRSLASTSPDIVVQPHYPYNSLYPPQATTATLNNSLPSDIGGLSLESFGDVSYASHEPHTTQTALTNPLQELNPFGALPSEQRNIQRQAVDASTTSGQQSYLKSGRYKSPRKKPESYHRKKYTSPRRKEVHKRRIQGACKTCRRRKVECHRPSPHAPDCLPISRRRRVVSAPPRPDFIHELPPPPPPPPQQRNRSVSDFVGSSYPPPPPPLPPRYQAPADRDRLYPPPPSSSQQGEASSDLTYGSYPSSQLQHSLGGAAWAQSRYPSYVSPQSLHVPSDPMLQGVGDALLGDRNPDRYYSFRTAFDPPFSPLPEHDDEHNLSMDAGLPAVRRQRVEQFNAVPHPLDRRFREGAQQEPGASVSSLTIDEDLEEETHQSQR